MKAVLFIHGLSAKKQDNEYFINYMNKMSNIRMYSFTLPGHNEDKMIKVKYTDWLIKTEEVLKEILKKHRKVIIVAHSMGTIIAVNLASKYKKIEKLILISPAFIFGNILQNKEDLKNVIHKNIDPYLGTGFEGAFTKLKTVPSSVWFEYRKMAKENLKNIEKITCKTLIVYGTNDNLVSMKSINLVYDKLKCPKEIVLVENVRHQVFKSFKKEKITNYIYKFITFNRMFKFIKKRVI